MHVYICPYCRPCKEARLEPTVNKHPKNNKRIWACTKCKETFVGLVSLLRECKRKIKEG